MGKICITFLLKIFTLPAMCSTHILTHINIFINRIDRVMADKYFDCLYHHVDKFEIPCSGIHANDIPFSVFLTKCHHKYFPPLVKYVIR